jgi:ankyrin repeat protein
MPLMAATQWPPILDLVLAKGADVHARNAIGQTALMIACDMNSPTVERLLTAGSDVNFSDSFGATPLIHAVRYHSPQSSAKLVRILLQHGAKPNARDKEGKTAISYARLARTGFAPQTVASSDNDGGDDVEDILSKALAKAQP